MANQNSNSEPPQIKLKNLSERLVYALETKQISQAELARKLKIKPQAIHYLCKSRCKKSGFTYQIANTLNISSAWLAYGEGSMLQGADNKTENRHPTQIQIPVLDTAQIRQSIHCGTYPVIPPGNQHITSAQTNDSGFAWQLQDKSMYPRFDSGTLLIANQKIKPKPKDFILIYLSGTDDIIFRQIDYSVENSQEIILTPINRTMYKPFKKKEDDILLGVIIEARWQIQ